MDLKAYKNIAIINFRALGDMICTMPLLKYCRKEAPQATITTILSRFNNMIGPFLNDSDRTIIMPARTTYEYRTLIKYGLKLRNSFDLVICANTPRKASDIFIWLLNAKNSLAYVKDTWHGKLVKTRMPFDSVRKKSRHCALDTLNLILPCESIPDDLIPRIKIKEEIKQTYQTRIQELKQLQQPLLLVSVSNNREECSLGIDGYAEILNKLNKEHKYSVIISYLSKDAPKALLLSQKLEVPNVVLETPDFAEFMVVLDSVDLCFIGEGGIMHLAAALDKPQVALFSQTSMVEWAPLSDKAIVLHHPEHVNRIDKELIYNALKSIIAMPQ